MTGSRHRAYGARHGRLAYHKSLSEPSLDEVLRYIMGTGIRETPVPIHEPLADGSWAELLDFVERERVAGLLTAACAAGLPASDSQRLRAQDLHRSATMSNLLIERVLLELADLLDDNRVEWRVLKGVAAARLVYPDPGLRTTGDVDVLVHPRDYDRVLSLVRGSGLAAWEYPSHGRATERHERGHTFMHLKGVELDIHRFVQGVLPRYAIPTATAFGNPDTIEIQGRRMHAMSPEAVIDHAMLHLTTGYPGRGTARLSTLADLMYARTRTPERYVGALELMASTGCKTPAAWADAIVSTWLDSPPATRTSSARRARVAVFNRMLLTPGMPEVVARLSGPERLRRMRETFAPSAEYRSHHRIDRSGHIRNLIRILRSR